MLVSNNVPTMLDNVQIAILTKVNELAGRFGIDSHECVAVLDNVSDRTAMVLRFDVPPSENQSKMDAFNQMLDLLGGSSSDHEFKGTPKQILEALDKTLHVAPRHRLG